MGGNDFLQSYSYLGDVCTIIIGVLMLAVLKTSFTLKDRRQIFFNLGVLMVLGASGLRMFGVHLLVENAYKYRYLIYSIRSLFYLFLTTIFILYVFYLFELIGKKMRGRRILNLLTWAGFLCYVVYSHVIGFLRLEYRIDESGDILRNLAMEPFHYYYVFMAVLIFVAVVMNRKYLVTNIRRCILLTILLSVGIVVAQEITESMSMLCFTFIMPMIPIACIFHNQGHDTSTGALDYKAFETFISNTKKEDACIVTLYLEDMTPEREESMKEHFYHFNEAFFRGCSIFQLDDHHFAMGCLKRRNKAFEQIVTQVIQAFENLYEKYHIDYKITWFEMNGRIEKGRDVYQFVQHLEQKMDNNEVYPVTEADFDSFEKILYLKSELTDLVRKNDLDDERVLVFCQPVLNTKTGEYSTAEALMRLKTEKYGIVFPDEFIPIAEEYGMIHTLSKIILHKTCKYIHNLEKNGKTIERISVNFSITELRDKDFCQNVIDIIKAEKIDFNKIAIELTESKNEKDFQKVKNMMTQLQEYGIKFYLDDFGTGYSNVERIIGLPIDIIKFDRSLTILSSKDEMSKSIVSNFSNIFELAKYQILFEGVEDEDDEQRCLGMHAEYLQGYKYSRPIPIEQLEGFLK